MTCFKMLSEEYNTRFHWPIVDLHVTETSQLSEARAAQIQKQIARFPLDAY